MYFKQENHQNPKDSLKGLGLYIRPCAQVSLVCALGHACAPPDSKPQEGAEKEGGWRSSQSNAFTLHQIPADGFNPLSAGHVSIQGFP